MNAIQLEKVTELLRECEPLRIETAVVDTIVLTCPNGVRIHITRSGDIYWRKNHYLHRDGGPAKILVDGTKSWFQNGKLDRTAGQPAIYGGPSGQEHYYEDGWNIV